MMVRTPLVPCSIASHSMARSQTCQNGSAHLPATKPKSMAWMPSPTSRLTVRWPKMRTTRTTQESRMKSHASISKLPLDELLRNLAAARTLKRGTHGLVTSEGEGQVADGEADHDDDPEGQDRPQHLTLVLRALLPEVDGDDPQAVEGVEDDRCDKARFTQGHEGVLVGTNHCGVGLGGHTHQ